MIKDKLQQDLKDSLRSGNSQKRLVVGLILNAVKNKELEKRTKASKGQADAAKLEELSHLSDDEVIDVVGSEIKKRKESIETYEKASRQELAQKEREELDILMTYMPEQLPEDEIRKIVRETIKDMGLPAEALAQAGKVIGSVMAKVKGKAEGTTVSRMVKEELSK